MRTSWKASITAALLVISAMLAQAASAAPIIGSGSVSMAGGFTPVGPGTDLSTAKGVHFLPAGPGNVIVTGPGGTGSFVSLTTGTTGSIHDFNFTPFTPVGHFLTIGGFTFNLDSVTVVAQTGSFLDLHGTATVSEAGFADTTASFDFSGQGGGAPATFSWSATAASAVAEPMTLGILGIGLAGFGFLRRRVA